MKNKFKKRTRKEEDGHWFDYRNNTNWYSGPYKYLLNNGNISVCGQYFKNITIGIWKYGEESGVLTELNTYKNRRNGIRINLNIKK